jgi:hypothetical protein
MLRRCSSLRPGRSTAPRCRTSRALLSVSTSVRRPTQPDRPANRPPLLVLGVAAAAPAGGAGGACCWAAAGRGAAGKAGSNRFPGPPPRCCWSCWAAAAQFCCCSCCMPHRCRRRWRCCWHCVYVSQHGVDAPGRNHPRLYRDFYTVGPSTPRRALGHPRLWKGHRRPSTSSSSSGSSRLLVVVLRLLPVLHCSRPYVHVRAAGLQLMVLQQRHACNHLEDLHTAGRPWWEGEQISRGSGGQYNY